MRAPVIWTFYSAERRVGRSMALANVAELCRRAGDRVVIVDWDLEAPGLDRLFPAAARDIEQRAGLIDLLSDYKAEMTRPIADTGDRTILPTAQLERYLTPVSGDMPGAGAGVRLMPAGRRSDAKQLSDYAERVSTFDWTEFLSNWEGHAFLEELRTRVLDAADVVLIDSSAGLSASSRICATSLADVVIMFCSPSPKSLDRTRHEAEQLLRDAVPGQRHGRPLHLVVVPARIDYGEAELLNDFKREFLDAFGGMIPPPIGADATAFWRLRIPNIPYFAYRESVIIARAHEAVSEPLVEAYERLTTALRQMRPPAMEQGDSGSSSAADSGAADLARFQTLRARKTETPSVFISYAREDENSVRAIYKSLIDAGFKAWLDKENLLGGESWESVIEEQIEHADFVLVCLSRVAVAKKGYVQWEVKKTLEVVDHQPEDTVFLIPVRIDACNIPRSLRKLHCVDLFEPNGQARLEESIRHAWRRLREART